MRALPMIVVCGLLTVATSRSANGAVENSDGSIQLIRIMSGLGPAPDMYIFPCAEDVPFDAITIEVYEPLALLSAWTISNTPEAAPNVIGMDKAGYKPGEVIQQTIYLDGPIPVGEWTRIDLDVESDITVDANGAPARGTIVLWVAHLPCDVSQDGMVDMLDVRVFENEYEKPRTLELTDFNGNGLVDVRDVIAFGQQWHGSNGFTRMSGVGLPPLPSDCNGNRVDDAVDFHEGTSRDVNQNGIPDDCETSSGRLRR